MLQRAGANFVNINRFQLIEIEVLRNTKAGEISRLCYIRILLAGAADEIDSTCFDGRNLCCRQMLDEHLSACVTVLRSQDLCGPYPVVVEE